MTVSALEAAKRIGKRSNWSLSNLHMQKMLYIANMFHLGQHGKPLVSGPFEAWDYGPVHPTLYHRAKIFGADPVRNIFRSIKDVEDGTESRVLDRTIDLLSNAPGAKLVAITHWRDGAWAESYRSDGTGVTIPNDVILKEYRRRIDRAKKKKSGRGNST